MEIVRVLLKGQVFGFKSQRTLANQNDNKKGRIFMHFTFLRKSELLVKIGKWINERHLTIFMAL